MENSLDAIALQQLENREKQSGLEWDQDQPVKEEIKPTLGKASFVNELTEITGMDSPWKKLPLTNLSSEGFGYPPGMEIAIRSAEVGEIRHFSIIDENDPIDVDDKINYIVSKCSQIKWSEGILSHLDLHQEDRFYVFMSIRDLTFIKGENRIFIPVKNECAKEGCPIPPEIELTSAVLSSFKLDPKIKKYYDKDNGFFNLTPKNGDSAIQLFIPSIGVSTAVRKILRDKVQKGKKYDETFAKVSTFVIPNWRDLDEQTYNDYESASKAWTYTQWALADSASDLITFATKSSLEVRCNKCGAEVAAPIRFRGGIRSLYVVSDIFGQLL